MVLHNIRSRNVCHHLGYSTSVDTSPSQSLNWISDTNVDKFMYQKSQAWTFSTCLKVVQEIIISIISYFLHVLSWRKKSPNHLAPKKYIVDERVQTWHELGFMESYLCSKTFKESDLTKLEDHMVV